MTQKTRGIYKLSATWEYRKSKKTFNTLCISRKQTEFQSEKINHIDLGIEIRRTNTVKICK